MPNLTWRFFSKDDVVAYTNTNWLSGKSLGNPTICILPPAEAVSPLDINFAVVADFCHDTRSVKKKELFFVLIELLWSM